MLIIYSHPNKLGNNGAILAEVERRLKKLNEPYEILDLYAMNFDPVMKANEHYTSGNYNITEGNKKIQEIVASENKFIFIYPTWWQNVPAILKGFFDRVFTARFAFIYEGNLPKALLKGKAVIFTTSGAPSIYFNFFKFRRSIKVVTKDTLNFCGIKTKSFLVDSAKKFNDKQQRKIEKVVTKGLNYLL